MTLPTVSIFRLRMSGGPKNVCSTLPHGKHVQGYMRKTRFSEFSLTGCLSALLICTAGPKLLKSHLGHLSENNYCYLLTRVRPYETVVSVCLYVRLKHDRAQTA